LSNGILEKSVTADESSLDTSRLEQRAYSEEILSEYERSTRKNLFFILILAGAIIITALIAVTIGPLDISIIDSYKIIFSHIVSGGSARTGTIADNAVWLVRLPRVLAGILTGFGLGIAGGVMQPLLKNPMASPFTLGISTSAGFGASLAIAFGAVIGISTVSVVASAFFFSMLSIVIILLISRWKNAAPQVIILTGISISYLFNAGISILQYFVDPIYTKEMTLWMTGSLYKGSWDNLKYIFPLILIISLYLIVKSKDLNAISSGDEVAKSIGINLKRTRISLLVASAVITATLVSFMGTIGFVGLVAPHMVRMIIGGDNRFVVIGSGLAGALLIIISDIIALHAMTPIVLPIGIITTVMGVPLFLYLILKMMKGNL